MHLIVRVSSSESVVLSDIKMTKKDFSSIVIHMSVFWSATLMAKFG